jgi:type II secretory pathway component GspD/PulD (secretin)
MSTKRVALALVIFTASGLALADDRVMEIIPLRHRTENELIPILRPMLDPDGALSGMNNQLIVRTSPANLAAIKQALASLDRAARRLRIEVRQDLNSYDANRENALSARYRGGGFRGSVGDGRYGRGGFSAGFDDGRGGIRYRMNNNEYHQNEAGVYSVQTVEGQPAYISTGQSLPIPQQSYTMTPGGVYGTQGTYYQNVNSGFYVVPRINGERVSLEISPQRAGLSQTYPGAINTQQLETTVTGQLGEWINLGGVNQSGRYDSSGYFNNARGYAAQHNQLWVKVEEAF